MPAGSAAPELAMLSLRAMLILPAGRCRLTGRFVLRSGRAADEYFDKYQFEADPALLDEIAAGMVPLVPEGTEVLAGLEMGGIAVVTALGRRTGLPCAFVRKEAKSYGTARLGNRWTSTIKSG
jgi:orotate phosphoribosyltransferase